MNGYANTGWNPEAGRQCVLRYPSLRHQIPEYRMGQLPPQAAQPYAPPAAVPPPAGPGAPAEEALPGSAPRGARRRRRHRFGPLRAVQWLLMLIGAYTVVDWLLKLLVPLLLQLQGGPGV